MKYQRGNALVYILIGVALFAALSYTFSRSTSTGSTVIDDEQAELYANQLITHAQQMEQVVLQMLMTGSTITDIDFTLPGEAGYGTNAQHQVYHPSGGGMNVFNQSNENLFHVGQRGWAFETTTNVEWTKTNAPDIIYSFLDIDPDICSHINRIITGDETIPNVSFGLSTRFEEGTGGNVDFTEASCASCVGKYNLCIKTTAADKRAFYNIIASE